MLQMSLALSIYLSTLLSVCLSKATFMKFDRHIFLHWSCQMHQNKTYQLLLKRFLENLPDLAKMLANLPYKRPSNQRYPQKVYHLPAIFLRPAKCVKFVAQKKIAKCIIAFPCRTICCTWRTFCRPLPTYSMHAHSYINILELKMLVAFSRLGSCWFVFRCFHFFAQSLR